MSANKHREVITEAGLEVEEHVILRKKINIRKLWLCDHSTALIWILEIGLEISLWKFNGFITLCQVAFSRSIFTIQINSTPSKIVFKFPVTHFPQVSNVNKISEPLHRLAEKVIIVINYIESLWSGATSLQKTTALLETMGPI